MAQYVTISGQQAVFLDVLPNWRDSVGIAREYKTDILTSFDGHEQRRALRQTARRQMEFSILRDRDDLRHIWNIMTAWTGGLLVIPDPVRSLYVGALASGASGFNTTESRPWLINGAPVCLQHKRRMEVRTVTEVIGYEVHFAEENEDPWPPGTRLRPLLQGRLPGGLEFRNYTDRVATAAIDFQVSPTTEPDFTGSPEAFFDDMEVLMRRPNWATPITLQFETETEVLDFDVGGIRVAQPYAFSSRLQKNAYLNRRHAEAEFIEQFFYRVRGRRGTFLMPTWAEDLVLPAEESLTEGETTAIFDLSEVGQMLFDTKTHKRLAVLLKDGRSFFNRITKIETTGGGWGNVWGRDYGGSLRTADTLITVRDPWPITITPDMIAQVSWLLPNRLASDSLTITWETETVSQFTLSTQSLLDTDYEPSTRSGWGLNYGRQYGGAA